jgi:FSR family fosmidomycin resistance protein-like MFS transporter
MNMTATPLVPPRLAAPVRRGAVTMAGLGVTLALAVIVALRVAFRNSHPVVPSSGLQAVKGAWNVLRKHRGVVWLLLSAGTLRVVAAAGAPIAVSYWLATKNSPKAEIGLVQSAFMAGIGLGGLVCAASVRPRTERLALWLIPLFSVPFLWAMPRLDGLALKGAAGASGLSLGIALPVFISYGQQLLPKSQRVASSLTMGVSWGMGGVLVAALIEVCDRRQSFDGAFVLFGIAVIGSSLLCGCLPRVRE